MEKFFKRTLSVFLVAVMVLGAAPLSGLVGLDLPNLKELFSTKAEATTEYTEGYYTYVVINNEVRIEDVDTSISGTITIPSSLGGYPVTSIGSFAFKGTGIASITIPNTIKEIGSNAFDECYQLKNVYFSGDIKDWCKISFYDLDSNPIYKAENFFVNGKLVEGSLEIPWGAANIGNYSFAGYDKLTSITIPDSIINIGISSFWGTGLETVTIPSKVKSIGKGAFWNCNNLTKINVDAKNTIYSSDANGVLFDKTKKELIQYPDNSTTTNYIIPKTVTRINDSAFSCPSLTNITIPDSILSIGSSAFWGCDNLKSVTFGENSQLKSIGDYAFCSCRNLTNLKIPESVTNIGADAFSYTEVWYANIKDGVIYIDNHLIEVYGTISEVYEIKKGTLTIADSAFFRCDELKSITIPNTVTSIGESAFYNCSSLMSISIPSSVTRIGDRAFMLCRALTSITISDSVTNMGRNVFYNTAYYDNSNNWENNVLYIGKHLIKADTSLNGHYEIKEGTFSIGYEAFELCDITSLSIPESLTAIDEDAFRVCSKLADVYYSGDIASWCNISFGDSPLRFGENLYIDGKLLEGDVNIPNSVTKIGNYAFDGSGITNVIISDSVISIGDYAFNGCEKLSNIEIPDSVKSIGDYAFNHCYSLIDISIPTSVTRIGNHAFSGAGLTSIAIPDSVVSIGNWAFHCWYLEFMHISLNAVFISGEEILDVTGLHDDTLHICSDSESCYAKEYAEANGYEFRICDGSHAVEGGEGTPSLDVLALTSTYPINGATSISYDDELVLTFNQNLHEDLYILDPNSAIKICDYNTDAVIYSIGYDDYGVTGFRDSPIVIEGNNLTIRNALHKLVPGSKYYVTISPNIILSQPDSDGNRKSFAGITDKDTWTFLYLSPSVKERYSLDVYFNEPTVSLSADESASISAVLSFNGATTFPEMTFSIDDTNVAEITEIKTESNITYATINGKQQGSTTITVTANTVDGNIVKKFPVFVSDPETVYYCNYIDGRVDEDNPVEVSGMYIDDFKHTENDDGSVVASFTVYNHEHCYGTVDIYDENGSLVDYEVIDMYTGEYQTDIFSHIGYTWKLTEGMVTGEMFDPDVYKSEVWCKKTEISIVVPQNGYYVISNNVTTSNACLAYNISTLLVEMLLKTNKFIDTLSKKDLLSISANSEKIAKAFSEEFLKELIKKGSDKVTDDLIDALIEFSVESQAKSAAGVEKAFDSFEDCLKELGLDVFETVKKSIVKVLKTSITETALNVLYELSMKSCGQDIVNLIYYNSVTVGKWLATADSIQNHTSSPSVYIYNQQNNSMRKSNGIVSYTTENYDTVFHTVILKSGDKVDYVNRLTGEQEKAKVYDISLIRDGESVQPKDSVTVYIPIPDGWNTDNLILYHISKETGKREKIPVEIENGYAKFVTDSFSYFILSTDELKFVDNFGIKTPSTATISYGDTLILHADVESVPSGTNIVWEVSGNGVSIKPSEDGVSCAVTSTKTGTVSINAKLVDESGEVLKDFDGEELTASQSIKSNAGFFQKIIAFFKKLFGLTKTIPQVFKGIF